MIRKPVGRAKGAAIVRVIEQSQSIVDGIVPHIETLNLIFNKFSKLANAAPRSGLNLIQALAAHTKYQEASTKITELFTNANDKLTLTDSTKYPHDINVLLLQAMLIIESIESLVHHTDQHFRIHMVGNQDSPTIFQISVEQYDFTSATKESPIDTNKALARITDLQQQFIKNTNFDESGSIIERTKITLQPAIAIAAAAAQPDVTQKKADILSAVQRDLRDKEKTHNAVDGAKENQVPIPETLV